MHPRGRSSGERRSGHPRHIVPSPGDNWELRGFPQKAGAPLSPCGASPLPWAGRSSALQESGELSPASVTNSAAPAGGLPAPPPCDPHPGVTSEPFQEEVVVLGGQGGQHVLQVLPKLRRGTSAGGSLLTSPWSKIPQAGDSSPAAPSPKKPSQPGLFCRRQGTPVTRRWHPWSRHSSDRQPVSALPLAGDCPQAGHQVLAVSEPFALHKGMSGAVTHPAPPRERHASHPRPAGTRGPVPPSAITSSILRTQPVIRQPPRVPLPQ